MLSVLFFCKRQTSQREVGEKLCKMAPRLGIALELSLSGDQKSTRKIGCCSDISMHFPTVILNLFISPFLAICLPQLKIWGKSRTMATAGGEEAAVTASPGAVFELHPKLCVCDGVMLKCLNKIARNL